MRLELELIVNYSTLSNLLAERKMLQTTMLVAITLLEKKLLTSAWIELENLLTNVLVCKVSWYSTLLVVVLVLDLDLSSWKDLVLITARRANWTSAFILLLKFLLQL